MTSPPSRPRPLSDRERQLIHLYVNCQLGMTHRQFNAKWDVNYEQIAEICDRSVSTVNRWFSRGRNYLPPEKTDKHHLALVDFLLEHYEEIPSELMNQLCPGNGA